MKFEELYTTNEKINAEKDKPESEKTEKNKTILTNDGYALASMVAAFQNSILNAIRSNIK